MYRINVKEGLYWIRKAARKGDSKAQYNLGRYYADGEFIKKNYRYAQIWLSKAAARGHAKAQRLLKSIIKNGEKRSGCKNLHQ